MSKLVIISNIYVNIPAGIQGPSSDTAIGSHRHGKSSNYRNYNCANILGHTVLFQYFISNYLNFTAKRNTDLHNQKVFCHNMTDKVNWMKGGIWEKT